MEERGNAAVWDEPVTRVSRSHGVTPPWPLALSRSSWFQGLLFQTANSPCSAFGWLSKILHLHSKPRTRLKAFKMSRMWDVGCWVGEEQLLRCFKVTNVCIRAAHFRKTPMLSRDHNFTYSMRARNTPLQLCQHFFWKTDSVRFCWEDTKGMKKLVFFKFME